jgi:hypothetical protein
MTLMLPTNACASTLFSLSARTVMDAEWETDPFSSASV